MKFLTKINRQYLIILVIILLLISIGGYFLLKKILINEVKEDVLEKEYAICQEIKTQNNLPNIFPIIETRKIPKEEIHHRFYKEIFLHDEREDENEPYLEYTNYVKITNQWYQIKIRHSLWETDALILAIASPLLFLLVLAFGILFFLTHKFNKTVWTDFENNLYQIEQFSFQNHEHIKLKDSNIEEFDRLNTTIIKMTAKLKTDYLSLKEFTENASHELQTPLAIISLNLEELLQQDLQKNQFEKISVALSSVRQMAKLNKTLLLLAKLDNHQFDEKQKVNLSEILFQKTEEFQVLMESKNIQLVKNDCQNFIIQANKELTDILITNLLINAISHNHNDGNITIYCNEHLLQICNTGTNKPLDEKNVFNRFTKYNSHSFGLGLAIIQQICNLYDLQIFYNFDKGVHCFSVKKPK